jgi:UDP-N-acetyl-alpha-D-muramoyl-L-alanyl-L-glutamate epimerase
MSSELSASPVPGSVSVSLPGSVDVPVSVAGDSFDPSSIDRFVVHGWDVVEGGSIELSYIELSYALVGSTVSLEFVEKIGFGGLSQELVTLLAPSASERSPRGRVVAQLLNHLTLLAGVSYFKAANPPVIELRFGAWTAPDLAAHAAIVEHGLGEYACVNNLDPNIRPTYEIGPGSARLDEADSDASPVTGLALQRRSLVPVGGGKDSCVSIEALRAGGETPTLVTVNRYPPIQHVIDASDLPDLALTRSIDRRLLRLNDLGALNGHVPATAIVSLCVVIAAVVGGYDSVVMSNERSASAGNVEYRGVWVNHQWSKSEEAEAILVGLLARATPELTYGSLLRPLSELRISQVFAQTCQRYMDVFTSCNRNFRLDPQRRSDRWCGECPKCQFVYLALGTVVERPELERIFGAELFATSPTDGFRALLGIVDWKPFECVGEISECRLALATIAAAPEWAEHPVVCALMSEVAATGWQYSTAAREEALAPTGLERLPVRWQRALAAVGVTA